LIGAAALRDRPTHTDHAVRDIGARRRGAHVVDAAGTVSARAPHRAAWLTGPAADAHRHVLVAEVEAVQILPGQVTASSAVAAELEDTEVVEGGASEGQETANEE
jgi:hypothetical protein